MTGLWPHCPKACCRSLLSDGIVAGVGAVLVFLPQIAMLFLFVAILEDCGYMARAAYLMDGMMSRVGLSGKSFIPLLSSFACAVPGIMATRVIEDRRDRLVTILVAPLDELQRSTACLYADDRGFHSRSTSAGRLVGIAGHHDFRTLRSGNRGGDLCRQDPEKDVAQRRDAAICHGAARLPFPLATCRDAARHRTVLGVHSRCRNTDSGSDGDCLGGSLLSASSACRNGCAGSICRPVGKSGAGDQADGRRNGDFVG